MKKTIYCLIVFVFFVSIAGHTHASSTPSGEAINFEPERIINFSKKVEKILASKGARVAIVSRVGRAREELPEGMKFTHTGFAVYSKIMTSDGKMIPGYAMYNLYQRNDKPDASKLVQDFPVDFFAGVKEMEAGIIIPSPELQKRLLQVIGSKTYEDLHNPKYSAIANPFNTKYQNCTEYILDVITAAIYNTGDITTIKTNEKRYFSPQEVHINPLKLIFGSIFIADIAVSDHADSAATATFTTIAYFLEKYNASSEVIIVPET